MPHAPAPAAPPLVLVNARLVDPKSFSRARGGLYMEDGRIKDLGPAVAAAGAPSGGAVVDCRGDVVAPGLVEMLAFV